MSEEMAKLLDLIQTSVDLANSVLDDLRKNQQISDQTILHLSAWQAQHNELSTLLDIANEVN